MVSKNLDTIGIYQTAVLEWTNVATWKSYFPSDEDDLFIFFPKSNYDQLPQAIVHI